MKHTRRFELLRAKRELEHASLGQRVRAARERMKLTQHALAIKVECRDETIHRLERGAHMPSAMLLDRIARVLESTNTWLLRGDPS